MIRTYGQHVAALALGSALLLTPAAAQEAPPESETSPQEIYEIFIGCSAYATVAAQMAGEQTTGPYNAISTRYSRAAVFLEPAQNAKVVDDAVMSTVGAMLLRRKDDAIKAEVDADFKMLDETCKQIDSNVLTGFLAEMDAAKP